MLPQSGTLFYAAAITVHSLSPIALINGQDFVLALALYSPMLDVPSLRSLLPWVLQLVHQ